MPAANERFCRMTEGVPDRPSLFSSDPLRPLLGAFWERETRSSAETARLRVAQSVALVRQAPIIVIGNGVGACLVAVTAALAGAGMRGLMVLGVWPLLMPLLRSWWRLRHRPPPDRVSERRIASAIGYSGALGLFWAAMEILVIRDLPFESAGFLLATAGFLGLSAVAAMAVIPAACTAYNVPLMATAVFVAARADHPAHAALTGVLLLMGVGMWWFTFVNWSLFEGRQRLKGERDQLVDQVRLELQAHRQLAADATAAHRALAQSNAQLTMLTQLDPLTKLFNRRAFDDALNREFCRIRRDKRMLSLLMIDVDRFKTLTDTFGHQTGDECLAIIAREISLAIRRPADIAARTGGEEFAIILPDTDVEGARAISESIRTAARISLALQGYEISLSVGVATHRPGSADRTPAELRERAAAALDRAKSLGRDVVCAAPEIAPVAS